MSTTAESSSRQRPASPAAASAACRCCRSLTAGATLIWAIAAVVLPPLTRARTLLDHSFARAIVLPVSR
ncbi:hypothetical protein ACFPOE_08625 [Caenimonas terrae]|uniref:Uncharacterized protein n=1 Tax=Caenimonas terrae TaxID=696074 RepID=A0ABW0NAL4_9BURK